MMSNESQISYNWDGINSNKFSDGVYQLDQLKTSSLPIDHIKVTECGTTYSLMLGGHALAVMPDEVRCWMCGDSYEIPSIFLDDGWLEVLYRMYLMGKWRHTECRSDNGKLTDIIRDEKYTWPEKKTPVPEHPGQMYWSK